MKPNRHNKASSILWLLGMHKHADECILGELFDIILLFWIVITVTEFLSESWFNDPLVNVSIIHLELLIKFEDIFLLEFDRELHAHCFVFSYPFLFLKEKLSISWTFMGFRDYGGSWEGDHLVVPSHGNCFILVDMWLDQAIIGNEPIFVSSNFVAKKRKTGSVETLPNLVRHRPKSVQRTTKITPTPTANPILDTFLFFLPCKNTSEF